MKEQLKVKTDKNKLSIFIIGEIRPFLWIGSDDEHCLDTIDDGRMLKFLGSVAYRYGYKLVKKD